MQSRHRIILGSISLSLLLLMVGGCPRAETQEPDLPPLPLQPAWQPPPPATALAVEPVPLAKLPVGFLYRSATGTRRFCIAPGPAVDGAPAETPPVFIPLGINYAWPSLPGGAVEYNLTMKQLADNGVNLLRIWQSSWGFDLGGWHPDGNLDGPGLNALDKVFRLAEQQQVKILLVYDNHFDVLNNQATHGLFAASGKPDAVCATTADYFQLPAARAIHAARIKTILARYGSSPAFFGLEFFNELDLALPLGYLGPGNERILEGWAQFMADTVLRERRAGNLAAWHPMGVSTVWPRSLNCYADPRFDWVSAHVYIPEGLGVLYDYQADETRLVTETSLYYDPAMPTAARRALPHRPWIMEYGFGSGGRSAARNESDPDGHHLRHGLWAALAAGGEGAPMPWWWDSYLLPRKLHRLYRPLANVVAELPWDQPARAQVQYRPPRVRDELAPQRHFRMVGTLWERIAFLYLAQEAATWTAQTRQPSPILRAWPSAVTVGSLPAGRYAIEWIDPATGHAAAANQVIDHLGGEMKLTTPAYSDDLAVVIHPEQ